MRRAGQDRLAAGLPDVPTCRASRRADVPGFRPVAGLVTREALPGFRERCRRAGLAAGLVTRQALPTCAGLVKIGLPPGFPTCRRVGLPARCGAGHSGSVADVAGQRRASGRHSGSVAGLPARCRAGHSGSVADVRRATSGFRPSLGKRKETGKGLPCPCESETTCQTAP